MHAAPADITGLLVAWGKGDRAALERRGHLLQATALVNEVYIRLVDSKNVEDRTAGDWR